MLAGLRLTRLKPTLLGLLSVAISLIVIDQSVMAIVGRDPAWLPPIYYNFQQKIGSRLAAIQLMKEHGELDEKNLVAVLGVSTVQVGLDSHMLNAADPLHRQWLTIASEGGVFENVEISTHVLIDSPVRPGLVVVGISRTMLHQKDKTPHTRKWAQLLTAHSWLFRNLWETGALVTIATSQAADDVRGRFGFPLYATYKPDPEPWAEQDGYPGELRAPEVVWTSTWTQIAARMDPSKFQQNEQEIESFRRIIRTLNKTQRSVVYVLMPEPSRIRNQYSPIVIKEFDQVVEQERHSTPVRIVDLRQSMPDEMFHDYAHLNSLGREKFSAMLPTLLR